MAITSLLDRSNTNAKREAIEAALQAGGLTQVAGGNRFRYFGLQGQGKTGYMVRVGIKAFRLVKRLHIGTGLTDLTIGSEKFHGKHDAAKVQDWAAKLVRTHFGEIKETPSVPVAV